MIPIRIISTQESEVLKVSFFPTDICNFNCSYCFPGSHDERYRYPKNVDLVIANFRKLFDVYTQKMNKRKFDLMIAGGGEPTMWPGLEKFCKEIKESHDVYITIITNGSRTLRWWKENSLYFDNAVLSCHHEHVDINHHISVGDLLFEAGLKVTALMLMDAKHWDKCVNYVEQMLTSVHPWYIQTKEIIDAPGHGMDVYTPKQLEYITDSIKRMPDSNWLLKRLHEMKLHQSVVLFDNNTAAAAQSHTILTNEWNKFQGWTCNVGFETISINASGQVLAGSCQMNSFDGKTINVFSENFDPDITTKQIICPLHHCSCQPDTHISKFKDF
jgi:organic radical activating enzyme